MSEYQVRGNSDVWAVVREISGQEREYVAVFLGSLGQSRAVEYTSWVESRGIPRPDLEVPEVRRLFESFARDEDLQRRWETWLADGRIPLKCSPAEPRFQVKRIPDYD